MAGPTPPGGDNPPPGDDLKKEVAACQTSIQGIQNSIATLTEKLEGLAKGDPKIATLEEKLAETQTALQMARDQMARLAKLQSRRKSVTSQVPSRDQKTGPAKIVRTASGVRWIG